jgi:hypothetical protein
MKIECAKYNRKTLIAKTYHNIKQSLCIAELETDFANT